MAERLTLPDNDLSVHDAMFLSVLRADIERLHGRHMENPREFFPFDFADEFDEAIRTGQFIAQDSPLPEEVADSLFVNYITEEGLPHYNTTLSRGIPKKHPFLDWLHQWTGEEGRHAPTIANYLHRTKQIDMRTLERGRMAMVTHPDTPQPGSFIESIVYPSFQEPATEISHRNTMQLLPKAHKIGKKALGWVIGDEVKHGLFYGDLTTAALEIKPSIVIEAIAKQVQGFAMPGKSIPNFDKYKGIIERAGIFGAPQLMKIYDDLITASWNIWDKTNLSADANRARDYLDEYLRKMGLAIEWAAQKRAAKLGLGTS